MTLSRDSVAGATSLLHPLSEQPFAFTNMEWGKPLFLDGDSLDPHTDLLGAAATIRTNDTIQQCILVMEVRDKATDSVLLWHGGNDQGALLPGTWSTPSVSTRSASRPKARPSKSSFGTNKKAR